MALVAILIKDEDNDVTVEIRSDSEMPENEEDLTPAQALAIVMSNAAFQESDAFQKLLDEGETDGSDSPS